MTVALELKVAQAMAGRFARYVKNHISTNNYRRIPLGMCHARWRTGVLGRQQSQRVPGGAHWHAHHCPDDASGDVSERMDYIGINTYRYVPGGPKSAYDGLASEVLPLPVPVILTEAVR